MPHTVQGRNSPPATPLSLSSSVAPTLDEPTVQRKVKADPLERVGRGVYPLMIIAPTGELDLLICIPATTSTTA